MNRLLSSVLTVLLIGALNGARADEAAVLDKDFRTMMQWFPGVYDNQEQVYFEAEQDVDEALRHERIHHVFEPVALPAFGDHVFYVQQHLNDDPAQIYRQRIYSFRADHDVGAIRLTIHIPNDAESLVDAHLDPTKLSGLLPEQTRVLPDAMCCGAGKPINLWVTWSQTPARMFRRTPVSALFLMMISC